MFTNTEYTILDGRKSMLGNRKEPPGFFAVRQGRIKNQETPFLRILTKKSMYFFQGK